LVRSSTGVFIGITTGDYGQLMRVGGAESTDVYSATGTALNAAAGRISYTLGLHGPCVALDTACSSSLVAVHSACQSLRAGECHLALAGGVNVILSPDAMVLFSKWGMMAPDGACKTFDAAADGFVRAEGCAVVALKLLSSAIEARDPILAVIRGSAVNSDGRSSGLTVPNGLAQQAVIRSALGNAHLQPADVDYVEAHGTGTPLGDPIEVEALGAVYGEGRRPDRPLAVASIKTNIGHSEAASGIAGLLKVVMQMRHDAIGPHLHFKTANPGIRWEDYAVSVPKKLMPWPTGSRIRRAGVSSFGFSGTNAHIIVEEAPSTPNGLQADRNLVSIITLSGRTKSALQEVARRLGPICAAENPSTLQDISTTLALGRSHHRHRAAFICDSKDALRDALSAIELDKPPALGAIGETNLGERRKVGFLFTGQGSQYAGMGRRLYDTEPLVRGILDRAANALSDILEVPLLDVMFNEDNAHLLAETQHTQPALFALEYALAELWRSWGIEPSIVAGHSVGEYVAACVAGVFSFEDGLSLIGRRGRLMQQLPPGGGMAAVFCGPSKVRKYVDERSSLLAIAGLNGPEETVLSGNIAELDQVLALLANDGVQSRRLDVSHAFHSPLLAPMLGSLDAYANSVVHQAPVLPLVSNVSGALFGANQGPSPSYWSRHARQPVNFLGVLEAMKAENVTTIVEVGPQPTLLALVERARVSTTWKTVGSLRRGRDDRDQLLGSLATIYTNGIDVHWQAVGAAANGRRISLPTYPFQRSRYWMSVSSAATSRIPNAGHPLLGERCDLASLPGGYVWQREVSCATHPWLLDHRVENTPILPATAYIEMAIAAGREVLSKGSLTVHDLNNRKPMILREGQRRLIQVALNKVADGGSEFNVHSRAVGPEFEYDAQWVWHASGQITKTTSPEGVSHLKSLETFRKQSGAQLSGEQFYKTLAERGNQWGPSFQGVRRLWLTENEAVGCIEVPAIVQDDARNYLCHPALSDACGHPLVAILPKDRLSGAFVGGGVEEIRFHRTFESSPIWAHATIRKNESNDRTQIGDVRVYDNAGRLVSETIGAKLWFLDDKKSAISISAQADWYYRSGWHAKPESIKGPRAPGDGPWLIFDDRGGLGAAIAESRSVSGEITVLVTPGQGWSSDGTSFTIDAGDASDYHRLVKLINPRVILYLWSAESRRDRLGNESLQTLHTEQVLRLVQSVRAEANAIRPRLWFVTSHAQKVVPTDACDRPDHAMLWGMLRALAAEHAELWGGLIDQEDGSSIVAQRIIREIHNGDAEDKVAFRQGVRYVPRLERYEPPQHDGDCCFVARSDVTYLVTGGLGGIGLELARWLVERGAKYLLLLSRNPLPNPDAGSSLDPDSSDGRKVAVLEAMKALGAEVEAASVDVASAEQIDRCLAGRKAAGSPDVGGVIHAAGILQFEALETQSQESLRAGLAAKVLGAWHLHRKFVGQNLDCFIMCSSSSALLNSPLLGGYAAGNAFLDALAEHRKAQGMSALSVNWGTWGQVGMASGAQSRGELLKGFGTIATARGLSALAELLESGSAHVAVMPVNWLELTRAYPAFATDRFLEKLTRSTRADVPQRASPGISRQDYFALSQSERSPVLVQYLRVQAAYVLGVGADELDTTVPLSSLGFDSLMAVQLRNCIELDLGVSVPMIKFLQGPSVEEVAPSILSELAQPLSQTSSVDQLETKWEEGSL
jgi:acyl transferase domain-containing protein